MNNVEILGNLALLIGSVAFLGTCFWVVYDLEKNNKKHRRVKKA